MRKKLLITLGYIFLSSLIWGTIIIGLSFNKMPPLIINIMAFSILGMNIIGITILAFCGAYDKVA